MSDPDKPRKGGFQPGNKFGKGRPKGTPNEFGPDLRSKLLAAVAASGLKKAKKAGVNAKVDGTEFFVEALLENTAAASALLSKLIPPEPAPASFTGPGIILNVATAAEGQTFCPGHEVLMPFEEAREAWRAFNAGPEAWAECLQTLEPKLTKAAFENLSRVPALERQALLQSEAPLLHLVRPEPEIEALSPKEQQLLAGLSKIAPETEVLSSEEKQLLAELSNLTDQLLRKYGLDPSALHSSDGDDAA